MSSSKYFIGILGLLLLCSFSSAYNVLGGEAYCGYGADADAQCQDCEDALNNNSIAVVYLNNSIDGATATCIDNPINFTNKTFYGNGRYMRGQLAGGDNGIRISARANITLSGHDISNFTKGIYITNSLLVTVNDSLTYNNSQYGVHINDANYNDVILLESYNNSLAGIYLQSADHTNVLDSDFIDNAFYGIYLDNSENNVINDSIVHKSQIGFYIVTGSNNNTFWFDYSYNNTDHGYYFDTTSEDNNLTYCNATNNTDDGFRFVGSSDNILWHCIADYNGGNGFRMGTSAFSNGILQSEAIFNGLNGIHLLEGSDDTGIYNTRIHDNGLHGIFSEGPVNNLIVASVSFLPGTPTATSSYNNGGNGIYFEDTVTNSYIFGIGGRIVRTYSNGNHGIGIADASVNISISDFYSYNNSLSGVSVNDSSDSVGMTSGLIYNNTQFGLILALTANNNYLLSSNVYGNGLSGIAVGSQFNIFNNNNVSNNSAQGFFIANNENNYTGNRIFNNNQSGIYLFGAVNIFRSTTLYGNSVPGANADIRMDSGAVNNIFEDTVIYTNKTGFEAGRYISQEAIAAQTNNFTNLTVCYNETIGCANWNFLNLSAAGLWWGNFIANPYFISLNSSSALGAEFNKSANLTIAVDRCSPLTIYKKTGFPTTLADVLTGDPYSTTYTCSDNVLKFPVTDFSGYAANTSLSQCFYANSPDTVYNVAADLVGNKSDGICITLNASNIMINCSGYSVTGNYSGGITYGIAMETTNPLLENITIQGCTVSNYTEEGILLKDNSRNLTIIDNTVFGIYNSGGGSGYAAIYVQTNDSIVRNNTVANNSRHGLIIRSAWNVNVSDTIAYNNSEIGILSRPNGGTPTYNRFVHNLAYNNTDGMYISGTRFTEVINNTAYGNAQAGFIIHASSNNITLFNNSAFGNYQYGFVINDSDDNNYTNITAHHNSIYGFFVYSSSGNNIVDSKFYANGYDLNVNNSLAVPATINVVNSTFTNPLGTLENYTVLSFSDSVAASTSYTINWSAITMGLPTDYISFAQKFINITAQVGAVAIDSITWHWTPAELGGVYNESLFVLSKYNASGWSYLNNTPDTVAHTLSLTNLNPTSGFGILQNNTLPNYCMKITSPGSYQLGGNAVGAPYNSTEVWPVGFEGWACVKIASDNVEFSCNEYNITNNGTSSAYGILVNGSFGVDYTNVTIRDCPMVNGYQQGVYIHYSDQDEVRNITVRNSTGQGIFVFNSQNINVTDNVVFNITNGGIMAWAGNNNLIRINTVNGSSYGIRLYGGEAHSTVDSNIVYNNTYGIAMDNVNPNNNTVEDNRAYENQYGIYLSAANENNITNNTVYNNIQHGFYLLSSASNYLFNNTAYSNQDNGFYLNEVTNTNITNITSRDNDYGVLIVDSPNTYVGDSRVYSNGFSGIRVDGGSDNAVLYNNDVTDNGLDGIQVYNSVNSNITENTVYANPQHGINIFDAWYHTVQGNTIYDNGGRGIDLANATNSNISDNRLYNNTDHGIQLRTYSLGPSVYNTFINNTIFNHTQSGIRLITNSDFNVFINNTLYNLGTGFSVESSTNTNMTGNDVSNTASSAYYFLNSDNNRLLHNRGYNTTASGNGMYFFLSSSNNYLLNNTANLADLNGFLFTDSTDNTFINNTAMFSGGCGFDIFWGSHRNYFENNTAYNHTASGFCGDQANHSLFVNNTAYNAGYDSLSYGAGFAFSNFYNYTFIDNVAYDNGASGLFPGYLLGAHFGLAGGDDITVINNICFNTTGTTPSLFGIGIADSENVLVDDNFVHGSFVGIPAFGNINASDVFGIPAPIIPIDNLDITNNYVELSFVGIWTLNATNTNVQHNEIQRSVGGIFLHTTDLDVYNNTINVSDPSGVAPTIIGMAAVNSPDATIHENNITTSFLTMGIGALLVGENNSQFYQNDINASGVGLAAMDNFSLAMLGIPALPPPFPNLDFQGNSYGLEIYNNQIHDSLMAGAFLINYTGTASDPTNNEFRSNDISNNGYGLMINNTDNVDFDSAAFTGNTLDNNGYGLGIHMSNDITVMRSGITITNSAISGVAVNLPMFGLGPSDSITIERIDDATGDYGEYYGNITNLLLVSNASDVNGRVLFPDVDVSVATLLDNTNFLLENDFVSLDSAAATDFNVTANVTLYTDSCAADVYTYPGFPQNRSIIVGNGTIYTPLYFNCAGTTADFGVSNFSGYALNVTIVPPPPGGGRGGGGPACEDTGLELLEIRCPDNRLLFLVTDEDDNPVNGARVALVRTTGGYWSAVSYTDSDGMVEFTLSTNNEYTVEVSGGRTEDYCSDSIVIDYTLCPEEGCYDDNDCEDTEYCEREDSPMIDMPPELLDLVVLPGICMPVPCECGEVYGHECHEYDCCADSDCPEGYVCEDHECVPRECESDSECAASEQCVDGECIPIEVGDCGYIANHTWYDYECCNDSDCPIGEICYEHECILYRIETNETGYVGDQHPFRVYPEGQYDITISDPDGRTFDVTTDGEGYGDFLLESEGKYGIELIEEEVPVIMVDVDSIKRPLPPPDDKPVTILDELLKYFWWLLILLLLVIGYILFRRRKKKKYKVSKE